MKKFTFAAVAAIIALAASFSSCGNKQSTKLKDDIDTISYTCGLYQSQGLKGYLAQNGIDTTYMDAFIKGLKEGANAGDDKKKAAYYAGIMIGQQVSNQMVKGLNHELFGEDSTQTVSLKKMLAGFIAGVTGKHQLMTPEEAGMIFQSKMKQVMDVQAEKKFGPNKTAGERFLAANKKKPGVTTLPSGVQYKVIKEGAGDIPSDTSTVVVNYELKSIDGKVLDSTTQRGEPLTMPANRGIKGWTEAICHMPVGSKWEVYIPQELAYGAQGQGQIQPFSALIFTIELVSIQK